MTTTSEIAGRWRSDVVLKRDVFSTVERGRFRMPEGEVDAVLRRTDEVPWWSWPEVPAHRSTTWLSVASFSASVYELVASATDVSPVVTPSIASWTAVETLG